MSNTLSENEAKLVINGLLLAMIDNDKEAREIIYEDLSTDDLKRVVRWLCRMYLRTLWIVLSSQGYDPAVALKSQIMEMGMILSKTEDDEE